ncbi:MAG: hypothetical protein HKN87_01425, partial [Saprospiraceae bacterium]|nr:hypothetical protein [Saprospiraceae bacterium]
SLLLFFGFQSCHQKETALTWNKSFYRIGTQSSPRATDLNGDGVKDIVLGAGRAEMAGTKQGVLALDGSNGEVLWQHPAPAHVVGSATLYDVTGDGVDDVFIGGRGSFLMAIDGKTGQELWRFVYRYTEDPILQYTKYNFYNSALTPVVEEGAQPYLLAVNGGNWNAPAGDSSDRHPGVLMLFNLTSGEIVAADTMPDGQESYMSPVCFQQPGDEQVHIIFGTGGETISGHLYATTLDDLLLGDVSNASILVAESGHGFIAPPAVVDLNGDGWYDVVSVSHGGKITATDGRDFSTIWSHWEVGVESNNVPAIGYFTGDAVPDILVVLDEGIWPAYGKVHQVMLDGRSGKIAHRDSIGCFVVSSPVVYDIDHDGYDDAIFNTNNFDCRFRYSDDSLSPVEISTQLIAFDFRLSRHQIIDESKGFKNIFSTPWIGDLDGDDYLDLIYAECYNPQDLQRFLGMRLKRISSGIQMRSAPRWGEYGGRDGAGIFQP